MCLLVRERSALATLKVSRRVYLSGCQDVCQDVLMSVCLSVVRVPRFQLGTVTLSGWLVSRVCRVSVACQYVCPRYKQIGVWFSQRAGFLLRTRGAQGLRVRAHEFSKCFFSKSSCPIELIF